MAKSFPSTNQAMLEAGSEAGSSSTGRCIRVAVADDHPLVTSCLESLLNATAGFECVGYTHTGLKVGKLLEQTNADVLILDVRMPGLNALDVMHAARSDTSSAGVVIYSGMPEKHFAVPLARLGARAFVDKGSEIDRLLDAVKAVSEGRHFFSPALMARLEDGPETLHCPTSELTPREFQILLRLADGETVRDIASTLKVSGTTVSSGRASLLRKLKSRSNSGLTRYALSQGLMG